MRQWRGWVHQLAQDHNITLKGSEFVFSRDTDPQYRGLLHRRSDGQIVTLYTKPSRYVGHLNADHSELVWQETVEGMANPPPTEVWAAPWPVGGTFTPRKVAELPGETTFVNSGAAGGWFVYRKDDATLRAIRTSDGKYVDAAAPNGFGWSKTIGVYNGEIWGVVHLQPGGGTADGYSVARVPVASLGTPK